MSSLEHYLKRHLYCERQISERPSLNLNYTVVIPCYNEPDILTTLISLKKCMLPAGHIEVIVVVNSSKSEAQEIKEQNKKTVIEIQNWVGQNNTKEFCIYVIHQPDLPTKFAGVGLARKIGMDEAVSRFHETNNPDGIILSIDADTTVNPNYFTETENAFAQNPDAIGCNIYFEHPVSGNDYPDQVYKAIIRYELYLRYYVQCLKYTGFPYAYHTIGSCFGIKAEVYAKQGGMNKRKAGEDFYFLHKVFSLGKFIQINTTKVIPSPRPSYRVPFGTGPKIEKIVNHEEPELFTYNPETLDGIKQFFYIKNNFFKKDDAVVINSCKFLPEILLKFLNKLNYIDAVAEINKNSATPEAFTKRFFNWFNAFRILKYLNFSHENHYRKIEICNACNILLEKLKIENSNKNPEELLLFFRRMEL